MTTSAPAIGLVPPGLTACSAAELGELMRRIRDAGIDHVSTGDHVSFWHGSGLDGFVLASAMTVAAPTLGVQISVYLLPLRHPVAVARQLSTLATLTRGNLVFGVGVGGEDRSEITSCGVDPTTRGRRTDESMRILRALLLGDPVTYRGEFYDLDAVAVRPAPDPAVPIVVGGRSDAALRRTGELGDGWAAMYVTADRFARSLTVIGDHAQAAGRADVAWFHTLEVWCGFGDTVDEGLRRLADTMSATYAMEFEPFRRYVAAGTPEDVADFLRPYCEAGVQACNLVPLAGTPLEAVEAVGRVRELLRQ